ncbi:MAG: acyl-CoA mutase large subunit family protein [Deltaproteobacteria bacterium]|nr:acyl-CoA mutase large subunit family protein [Deltaproteobacteria bacterium]
MGDSSNKTYRTGSDIEVRPVYRRGDVSSDADDAPDPGSPPFTRGLHADGYRTHPWTIRQRVGFGTPRDTNERLKTLAQLGQTGIAIDFDLPTHMGYDVDNPLTQAEVGKVGVNVMSLADMRALFDGIDLSNADVMLAAGATAPALYAMYVTVAREQGASDGRICGSVKNDVLKEYVAWGNFIYPPSEAIRLSTDLIAYASKTTPNFAPLTVAGYHLRDAGCSAVEEIAYALAFAREYLDALKAKGADVGSVAGHIRWFLAAHNDLFEEAAKFRALRRLWATMLAEQYGVTDADARKLRVHAQTAGSSLQYQQPEVNIVRAAYQGLAAVLGGVQSLDLACHDNAMGLPGAFAQQLAIRTQQVLAHETGVANTADPLGGSYFLESLTDEIAAKAQAILDDLIASGGAIDAIEQGNLQAAIGDAAYRVQQRIERDELKVVGLNAYTDDIRDETHPKPAAMSVDAAKVRTERVAALENLRKNRDNAAVEKAVQRLRDVAADPAANLMEPIFQAVAAEATVGEIASALAEQFGRYGDVMAGI